MLVCWLLLMFLLGHGGGFKNYGRTLEFIIPQGRHILPTKMSTSLRSLILPNFARKITPVQRAMSSIEDILVNGTLFDESKKDALYPLYETKKSIRNSQSNVNKTLKDFEKILEPSRVGQRIDTKATHFLAIEDFFPELGLAEISQNLRSLKKNQNIPNRAGSGDVVMTNTPEIRDSKTFENALHFSNMLNQDLRLFSRKFRNFVDTLMYLKRGDIKALSNSFFFKANLEKLISTQIKVLDVNFFEKSDNQFEIVLHLAEYSGVNEFVAYHNVQYYQRKLSKEYFGNNDNNEIFELTCFAHNLCIPTSTACSRALYNQTAYDIFKICDFEHSDLDFEIVTGVGVIVNVEPTNPKVVQFLEDQEVSPTDFPVLIEFSGCFNFEEDIEVCFKKDKAILYSRFKDEINALLNPLWYVLLVENFKNVPLMLYVSFWILISFLLFFGSFFIQKSLRKFLRERKQKREVIAPSAPVESDQELEQSSSKERKKKSHKSHRSRRESRTRSPPS